MKTFRLLSLPIIVLIVSNLCYGQAGTTYSPSLDLYVNNDTGGLWHSRSASQMDSAINNQMMQQIESGRVMLVNAISERMGKEIDGAAKIRAGRATTSFKPVSQYSIVEQLAATAQTPQEKQEIRESVSIALQTFNNILKAKRLAPFDTSNGNALAFVLSYLVYNNGEDPGDARLLKMSRQMHGVSMKDTVYQGTPDGEKQPQYEIQAYRTMMAVRAYEASLRVNTSAKEKQEARETARRYAAGVMNNLLLDNSADKIQLSSTSTWGFENRGEAIVASNKATVTFTRSNTVLAISALAKQYDTSERKIKTLLSEFDAEVKRRGGAINDAAWVNAVSFVFAYEVYTGGKVKLNQAQLNWVLKEMQKDMLEASFYQAFTDEEKQKYYEGVAIKTMVVYDEYQTTSNEALIVKARERLNDIFSPRKLDDYNLTPNGFVKKR